LAGKTKMLMILHMGQRYSIYVLKHVKLVDL